MSIGGSHFQRRHELTNQEFTNAVNEDVRMSVKLHGDVDEMFWQFSREGAAPSRKLSNRRLSAKPR